MKHSELAAQINEMFKPRVINDEWDRGYSAAIERITRFLEETDPEK